MTTSPAPPAQAPLLNERAASIGWYFIESYYNFYNTNIESIHKLYHAKASLSHAGFPSGAVDGDKIHQATGIDAIKARFTSDTSLKKNDSRIVVSSADIQVCLGDKILIVVTGEWSKGGLPYWSFSQTFLLSPGRKENSLDLTNDILRFPGFQDYNRVEGKAEVEESSEPVVEPKTETKTIDAGQETKVEPKAAAKEPKSEPKSETKAEAKVEQKEKSPEPEQKKAPVVPVAKVAAVGASKTEAKPEEVEAATSTGSEAAAAAAAEAASVSAAASASAPKLSWAANLAATTVKPSTKSESGAPVEEGSSSATSTGATPPNSPPSTTASITSKPVVPVSNSVNNGPKYKKDEWFPIYIRGIRDPITEDSLRKHLSAKFGPIKFLKVNIYIALCDFVDFESQQKALDAKETTLSGITIQLEVRESKGASGSSNGNGGYIKVGSKTNSKDSKKAVGDKRIRDKKQGKKVVPTK